MAPELLFLHACFLMPDMKLKTLARSSLNGSPFGGVIAIFFSTISAKSSVRGIER